MHLNLTCATSAQAASSRLFEGQVDHSEWKERERQRFAHYVASLIPDTSQARVLLLDGHGLLATKALQAKGVLLKNIHVPNWEAGLIASKHHKRDLPNLYTSSLSEYLHRCEFEFDAVWLDTCCQCTNAQLADIEYMFEAELFNRDKNTLFFATYCGKRELEHNAALRSYEQQGIKRTEALRLLISEYAIKHRYVATTPLTMALDMTNHGMFSVAAIIKADDDPSTSQSLTRMQQVLTRHELDCSGLFPCAETSMLPVRVLSVSGKRARCEPMFINVPCVTETKKRLSYNKEPIMVPLKRLKQVPAVSNWDDDTAIGSIIEVAWRESPTTPISWWKARLLETEGTQVLVEYVFHPKVEWVDKKCCRFIQN